jgi:uncharacterized protein
MGDLHVSWDDYHHTIETLAIAVDQSGWSFNQIVCLAKGGVRVGDTLARLFDVPLAILTFSRDLTMTTPNLGNRVLVVDDLVDSGITLKKSLVWLDRQYGFYIDEVRTAVLWYKACSEFAPDYYVDYLPDNPWIHQPFERYETMTVAELAAQKIMG